jgi:hypothetical protein
MLFRLLILLLLPLALFSANGKILESSKSVIRVISVLNDKSMATGTAFCINKDGYFLTNAHVVDRAKSVFAVMSTYKYDVEVIKKLDNVDLAILRIRNTGLDPLTFAYKSNINVTDKVSSIGFPGAADKSDDLDELTTVTINSGIIGKLTKINLSIRNRSANALRSDVVQHDAAVNHGNSGGPLVNECGHVVGVNVQKGLNLNRSDAQIIAGDVVQGIFYAIDVDIAKKALRESHISFLETGSGCSLGSASMSVNERKYLIIGGILALLLAIWSIIYYTQENKKKNGVIDESALSRLISRKMGNHKHQETPQGNVSNTSTQLRPIAGNLPVFDITQIESTLGRSRSASFHLDDAQVSGKHLTLVLNEQGSVIVKDLGSTNGTYIEGRKLKSNQAYILNRGERLVIGSEDVIYTL